MPKPKGFDWDEANINKNWTKHRVSAKESEEVFENQHLTFIDRKHSKTEKRYTALGFSKENKLLFISFTLRKNHIRIISARNASRKERRLYEQKTKAN